MPGCNRATAVHIGLDFTVGRGVTGLLGSNGSGKTTLLGMILGLHRQDSGELRVLGLDPSSAGPEVRARLGYSPEHHTLPPDVRAHDLVCHIAFDAPPLTRKERANNVKKRNYFAQYGEQARAVLEALLEKYADHGITDIEDAATGTSSR